MINPESPAVPGAKPGTVIECVQTVARYFGRPTSRTVLFSGIPLDVDDPTEHDIAQVAGRLGLEANRVEKPLERLLESDLPALVVLDQGKCFVIVEQPSPDQYAVQSSMDGTRQTVDSGALARIGSHVAYSFTAIYINDSERAAIGGATEVQNANWLGGTLRLFWRSYVTVAIAALFINLIGLASPIFVMNVYDRILPNQAVSTLWVLGMGMGVALLFDFLLKTSRSAIIDSTGRAADLKLSYLLFEKVLNAQMASKSASTGEFANRIGQYEFVREFFTSNTIATIIDAFFVFIFVGVIYWIAGWLAIIPMTAFLLAVIIGLVAQYRISRRVARAANESAARNALLVEGISTIETIKALRAEGPFLKRWQVISKNAAATSQDIKQISAGAANATQFVQQLVSVAVIIAGAYQFAAGNISTGGIIATVILSGKTVAPLGQIALTLARLRQAILSLQILNSIMELPDDRATTAGFVNREVRSGKVEFQNVDFAYPETDVPVFNKLSFAVGAGEKVGIIGRIGSGKTTLGKLISGLYLPTGGRMLLDGVDVRQYHPFEVRKAVGFAGQAADLFSGTLKENLLLANPDATDEQLLEICRLTGVDHFASRHPRGYDMPVGERGDRLSGGQRQAVAIARLLLTDPKIIFLDEPSGAMDMASEKMLLQTLESVIPRETTLFVATHRSSMLDLVDRVIVLDSGRVAVDGPKAQVMSELARRAGQVNAPGSG